LRVIRQIKAISTLLVILLLLCSAIIGALVSYMWVMSSYYNMPEDSTLLVVEDVTFPIGNFSYFNLTVLNPSNSASDVNITAFRLTVKETNETYDVATIEYPDQLPFLLARGTRQTFKCIENWSNFAGDTVRIEPIAAASTESYPYVTPREELTITPSFDSSQTVGYFNLTVANSENSIINLTISEISVLGQSLSGTTPALPYVLPPSQAQVFQCERNWDDLRGLNVTVTVRTAEGYESTYETNQLQGAVLSIDEVRFDYADTKHFNITVHNAQDSTEAAILSMVNLTMANVSAITLGTLPPLNIVDIPVSPNDTLVVECFWDWSTQRSMTVTVSVFTKQGFAAPTKTVVTPDAVVWNITEVKFDLSDTDHFLVNVTNTPCSLGDINVTMIQLNDQNLTLSPPSAVLASGEQVAFSCAVNWTSLIGQTVSITAFTDNGMSISRITTTPFLGLRFLNEPTWEKSPIPYVNITISNSNNSLVNATLVKVIFETENQTYEVDGTLTNPPLTPNGSVLRKGDNVTIACPWNWTLYPASDLTVTVQTEDGSSISQTFKIPDYTP